MSEATPRSRRNRPAKPPLSRDWIVEAATQILREDGLSQVTMRRVAQALDTGAASLYVYIANTTELHAELLNRLLADLQEPVAQTQHWEESLLNFLGQYGDILSSYPGLARSALTMRPSGPYYLRVHEVTAGLLLRGGIPIASALWGADLLILLVTASAAEHTTPGEAGPGEADGTPPAPSVLTSLHPLLSAHSDLVFGGTPQQRQRWQLQTILAGLRQGLVPLPTLQE